MSCCSQVMLPTRAKYARLLPPRLPDAVDEEAGPSEALPDAGEVEDESSDDAHPPEVDAEGVEQRWDRGAFCPCCSTNRCSASRSCGRFVCVALRRFIHLRVQLMYHLLMMQKNQMPKPKLRVLVFQPTDARANVVLYGARLFNFGQLLTSIGLSTH